MESNEQTITCHFCFETFEIDLGIDETFSGRNTEIFDCEICCNPNKVDTQTSMILPPTDARGKSNVRPFV